MHYKFIWYCFLVINANTLLQYFLTIDFTGRIKKKNLHEHGLVRFCCSTRIRPSPPMVSIQHHQSSGCALFICCCLHVLLFDLAGMHANACCSAHVIVI